MSNPAASSWQPRSAWADIVQLGRFGRVSAEPGVRLDVIEQQGLATVIVRGGEEAALDGVIRDRFGLPLPPTGRAAFTDVWSCVWSAPGQWLLVGAAGASFADLPLRLAGIAAVTDQSDGRALIRISGSDARAMLAKGFSIDLHACQFVAGSTAVTSVAHITVQLWQVDDGPTFLLAVPRGFAGSFWSWLTTAAAEYGYTVGHAAI